MKQFRPQKAINLTDKDLKVLTNLSDLYTDLSPSLIYKYKTSLEITTDSKIRLNEVKEFKQLIIYLLEGFSVDKDCGLKSIYHVLITLKWLREQWSAQSKMTTEEELPGFKELQVYKEFELTSERDLLHLYCDVLAKIDLYIQLSNMQNKH